MPDEIYQLLAMVNIHRNNLQSLLKKIAVFGTHTPNYIIFELQDIRKQIADLKQQLAALGHRVDDQPGDIGNPTEIFRTPQEEAFALLATMPTDSLPEPRYEFAPGSRWYGLERNPDFVGREDELCELATALKTGTTAAVGPTVIATGMGGIGKTDLATEFAFRYGRFFAGGVFWLSFAEPEQVDAEIAACGGSDALKLFLEDDQLEIDDQVRMVLQVWSQPIPRLIICDNCDDQALFRVYREKIGPQCRLLVTSRDHTWKHPSYTRIALDRLRRSESIHLLQRLCSRLSANEADTVANELGDFPLALHLAGSYLATYNHTVDFYLTKLTELDMLNHPSMQGRGAEFSPTDHDLHVARTFALSFDRLDEHNPIDALAIHLLACAAQLAPGEPIPRDFLLAMVPEGTDHDDVMDGLNRVRAIGLIDGHETLIMHRLVHQYIYTATHNINEIIQVRVRKAVVDTIMVTNQDGTTLSISPIEPHLFYIAQSNSKETTSEMAHVLAWIAHHFLNRGRFTEAEPLFMHALKTQELVLGTNHQDTAITINNLAIVYTAQGQFNKAEKLFIRALEIRKQILGIHHIDTARSFNNLADLYVTQGRFNEAEPLFIKSLDITEHVLGVNHPDTIISLNNLAAFYFTKGQFDEAEVLFNRILETQKLIQGEYYPQMLESFNNLAALYYSQEQFDKAEPLYTQALDFVEQMHGSDHPYIAGILNNLALLYETQERYVEAESFYKRGLSIIEQALGSNHPNITTILNNLALLFQSQKQYAEAELFYKRALFIVEQVLGSNHSDTAITLSNLATIYYDQGYYTEAIQYADRAFSICLNVLGESHPTTNLIKTVYEIVDYHKSMDSSENPLHHVS